MRLLCKCGEALSNTEAPNVIELRVYTDREWGDIINMVSLPKRFVSGIPAVNGLIKRIEPCMYFYIQKT